MLLEEPSLPEHMTDLEPSPSSPDNQRTTRSSDRIAILSVIAASGPLIGLFYLTQLIVPASLALAVAAGGGAAVGRVTRDRVTGAWLGVVGWAVTCTAATVIILDLGNAKRHQLGLTLGMVVLAGVVTLGVWAWDSVRRKGVAPANLVGVSSRVFLEPSTGLAPLLVGAGMGLPLIGTYGPHAVDADSAWIVTSTQESRDYGVDLIQETQDVLLPHLTIGPLLDLGGYSLAIPLMIVTLLAFVALTAFLGQRISGHGAGAFVAAAAVLSMPAILARTDHLPMYAATFAFAYGSIWLLHQAMAHPARHRWLPVLAGIGFVLAFEAHNVGQIFLMAPFLLLILHSTRQALRPLAITLATIAVFSIPRILINLSVDGLSRLRSNYDSWGIQNGYLKQINQEFYGQNVDTSTLGYVTNIPGMIEGALGGRGIFLLLAVPVVLAALRSGRRALAFSIACMGMFFLALIVAGPATYDRYVTPLAAGFAVLAGVGIVRALREPGTSRTLAQIMIVALLVSAFYQMSHAVTVKVQEHAVMADGPLPVLASHIDDDRRVLGIRSHELARANPEIRTLFGRKMSEEDFITYMTWPSDDEVTALMDRLDVGWVYVLPEPRFEVLYHETWLEPAYGKTVNHPLRLAASNAFCLVQDLGGYRLYRYGGCQPGDEGVDGPTIDDPSLNPYREEAGLPLIPEPDSDSETDMPSVPENAPDSSSDPEGQVE